MIELETPDINIKGVNISYNGEGTSEYSKLIGLPRTPLDLSNEEEYPNITLSGISGGTYDVMAPFNLTFGRFSKSYTLALKRGDILIVTPHSGYYKNLAILSDDVYVYTEAAGEANVGLSKLSEEWQIKETIEAIESWADTVALKEEIPTNTSDLVNDSDYVNGTQLSSVRTTANEALAIARGANRARVFDTSIEMQTWLSDPAHTALLQVGDNLYIKALNSPDYWWDGTQAQELETQKVDLTNYYNKTETDEAISAATATKQDTLVSGTNIKTVNGASLLGSGDIEVQSKTSKVIITDGSTVALADNTEYSGTSLTDITFTYPQGDFECYMNLNFADSGTITVTFPTSSYIGNAPTFANGETWEISIKNGVIVAGKVESNA